LQAHLCGLGGLDGVLPAADFADLHQPRNGSTYALGWARTDLPGGAASFHIGGTGAFTTIAALLPETGRGVAVMMNAGGEAAQSAGVSTVLTLLTPED
jgi:CubicO group peptidase (beta-lactamase class C family)